MLADGGGDLLWSQAELDRDPTAPRNLLVPGEGVGPQLCLGEFAGDSRGLVWLPGKWSDEPGCTWGPAHNRGQEAAPCYNLYELF